MNDFDYYDKEPKKTGKGFLIISLSILAIVVAGVLMVQYIVPVIGTNPTETKLMETTPTPSVENENADGTEKEAQETQVVSKAVSYISSAANAIPDIVENVSPAVVGVINYAETSTVQGFGRQSETKERPQGSGSGVIISEDGYIVTNNHVIEGASRVTVTLNNGEELTAEVIGSDQYVDLALLKIEAKGLEYLKFGDSDSARAGELAIAIGYPLTDDFSTTIVTAGILSAVGVDVEVDGIHFEMLQTDAPINPGNSGGALVDGSGQLIGINTLKTVYAGSNGFGQAISAEGIGYAIPSHVVQPIIDELMEYGEVVRPFIGIAGRVITQADSEYYDLPRGMYIDELTKDGPAQNAGVKKGDIITHMNGEEILAFEDLYSMVMSSEVGEKIKFTVYRSETEETLDFEVKLGSSIDY